MAIKIVGYPCVVRHLTTEEGGGFLISFPDLPGCMSDGDNMAEAKRNAEAEKAAAEAAAKVAAAEQRSATN